MADPTPLPHPGVRIPPPLLFVIGYGVGWLLERWRPLPLLATGRSAPMLWFGWLGVALGLLFMIWGMITFRRHRTAIIPILPASRLVMSGPYRLSRNPMYVGFTTLYVGASLLANALWPLLLLPIVLALLVRLVIRKEERYLADAFGPAYEIYRQRVRRWL
jgi:protein-S-isoprenylcysteine O-methyltransferase Ste14